MFIAVWREYEVVGHLIVFESTLFVSERCTAGCGAAGLSR